MSRWGWLCFSWFRLLQRRWNLVCKSASKHQKPKQWADRQLQAQLRMYGNTKSSSLHHTISFISRFFVQAIRSQWEKQERSRGKLVVPPSPCPLQLFNWIHRFLGFFSTTVIQVTLRSLLDYDKKVVVCVRLCQRCPINKIPHYTGGDQKSICTMWISINSSNIIQMWFHQYKGVHFQPAISHCHGYHQTQGCTWRSHRPHLSLKQKHLTTIKQGRHFVPLQWLWRKC